MIAEPVMGAGGVIVPPAGYFPAIQAVLDSTTSCMIDDEVINGFGRTGNWWGCQTHRHDADDDLGRQAADRRLCAARRGTGAGRHLSGLCRPIRRRSARFGHGFTYGGHPLGCALGAEGDRDLPAARHRRPCPPLAPTFAARLERLGDHPLVGETRCSGWSAAVELVADKKTKPAFRSQAKAVGRAVRPIPEAHGAILRALGDTVAFCPPMIIKPPKSTSCSTGSRRAWPTPRPGSAREASARPLEMPCGHGGLAEQATSPHV